MLFLLVAPLSLAYSARTGISPLNRVVELMAQMFNIPILKDPAIQVYFLRFMLFVLFLVVAHYAFKKVGFDNKTAGVVATVFAAISSFLMPEDWVAANGGVVTAVFAALIPLGIVCAGVYFCVTTLNKSFITRLIAIVILMMLLAIIDVYRWALNLPLVLLIPTSILSPTTKPGVIRGRGERR